MVVFIHSVEIFLVLDMISDFLLKPGHFLRMWISLKLSASTGLKKICPSGKIGGSASLVPGEV